MAQIPVRVKHGSSESVVCRYLYFSEYASDPADPPEGMGVMWMSDGTGTGNAGDIIMKTTQGGTTVTGTVVYASGP